MGNDSFLGTEGNAGFRRLLIDLRGYALIGQYTLNKIERKALDKLIRREHDHFLNNWKSVLVTYSRESLLFLVNNIYGTAYPFRKHFFYILASRIYRVIR